MSFIRIHIRTQSSDTVCCHSPVCPWLDVKTALNNCHILNKEAFHIASVHVVTKFIGESNEIADHFALLVDKYRRQTTDSLSQQTITQLCTTNYSWGLAAGWWRFNVTLDTFQVISDRIISHVSIRIHPTVSKHWRRVVSHPDRPQSHQAHVTMSQ